MNKLLIAAAASVASLTCIGAAVAQPPAPPAPLTRAQVQAQVAARFARMDANRDGTVTREEVAGARDAKRTERRQARFAALDTDRNGQLSPAEFAARPPRGQLGWGRHGGRGAGRGLARLDANGDGSLTRAEAETAALARFDRLDADRSGTVTPEERRVARGR